MLRTLLPALLLLCAALPAGTAEPKAGVDYEVLPPPATQPAAQDPKSPVTVTYFFSHHCHACAQQAQAVDQWLAKQPAGVATMKVVVPMSNQKGKEPTNETYQALRQLPALPQVEELLFTHLARGQGSFPDQPSLLAWLGKAGVPLESFEKSARSFSVAIQVRKSNAAVSRLMSAKAANFPVAIVDDRYLVTMWSIGRLDEKLATLDALVAKARSERATR